jgi:hypothetical protein
MQSRCTLTSRPITPSRRSQHFSEPLPSVLGAFWKQEDGTAMGTPPAPTYATLYFGIHELAICPTFAHCLVAYFRYIDDCHGVWLHHPDPAIDLANWNAFQVAMNSYGKLTWEFTPLFSTRQFYGPYTLRHRQRHPNTYLREKTEPLFIHSPAFRTCTWNPSRTCHRYDKPNLPSHNFAAGQEKSNPLTLPSPQ